MPKVWLALFFGYNGQNFQGMQHQRQESVNSIEKLLIVTLNKEGFLACKNYGQLVKNYRFGRAARTDKGVHAIINGISCLFTIPESYYDETQTLKKNQILLKLKVIFQNTEIVVHAIRRVTCRFDIRQMVKARTYCYICPLNYFVRQISEQAEENALKKIRECCQKFIGTHNFHNYSKDIKAKDPKAKRYVLQFGCEKLNEKWLKFTIRGQSFVYHQIRKIVGCIIQVFMSDYEPSFIDNTFFNNQFYVPLAPPFGLFLRYLTFESYNRKPEIPEKIDFEEEKNSLQQLESIITEHIFKVQQNKWDQWYKQSLEGVIAKFSEDQDISGVIDDE